MTYKPDQTLTKYSASIIAKGRIVKAITVNETIQVTLANSNLRNEKFVGISLIATSVGQYSTFLTGGILDPNIFNLGDGYACAVGANSSGVPVRATDPTCVSAPNWIGNCDTNGTITVNPRRPDFFNVKDFGAFGDDVTDDLFAFKAMISSQDGLVSNNQYAGAACWIPPGKYYLSDNLFITKALRIDGAGTGAQALVTQLRFPAGKGIIFQTYTAIENPGYAFGAEIMNIELRSDGWVPSVWADTLLSQSVTAGTMVRAVNEMDSVGPGRQKVVVDGYYPDTTEENRCRRFKTHGDNRFIYECTTDGYTEEIEPAWNTAIGQTTTWGTSVWTCRCYPGILIRAGRTKVRNVSIHGFTNAGYHVSGVTGVDNSNDWRLDGAFISQCGIGIATQGAEANSGMASDVYIEASGYRITGSEDGKRGGHGVWDHSFLGNAYVRVETAGDSAVNSGRGYIIDGTAGRSCSLYLYAESDQLPCHFTGTSVHLTGPLGTGMTPTSTSPVLNGDGFFNNSLFRKLEESGTDQILQPLYDTKTYLAFKRTDIDGSNYVSWQYEFPNSTIAGTGWFWLTYGWQYGTFRTYGISNITSPEGPGWAGQYQGGYKGSTLSPGMRFEGVNPEEEVSKFLRNGFRKVGDTFQYPPPIVRADGHRFLGKCAALDGYQGETWSSNRDYVNATDGLVADFIEPTAGKTTGMVYMCTVSGNSGGTEPTSYPIVVGSTVAVGTATFECIGRKVVYDYFGPLEPALVNFSDISDLILDLNMDIGLTSDGYAIIADGYAVNTIEDQSGSENNFSEAVNPPTLNTNDVDFAGHNSISIDGGTKNIRSTDSIIYGTHTIIAVITELSVSGYVWTRMPDASTYREYAVFGSPVYYVAPREGAGASGKIADPPNGLNAAGAKIAVFKFGGTHDLQSFFINDTNNTGASFPGADDDPGTDTTDGIFVIGKEHTSNTAGGTFKLARLLIWDRELNLDELRRVTQKLRHLYNCF